MSWRAGEIIYATIALLCRRWQAMVALAAERSTTTRIPALHPKAAVRRTGLWSKRWQND